MPSYRHIDFSGAVNEAGELGGDVSLLLGNGFSIDYDAGMFSYSSLAQKADLTDLMVPASDLFGAIDSHDFETLIDYLSTASEFNQLYGGNEEYGRKLLADADVVRGGLASALAASLPNDTYEMDLSHVAFAKRFLARFDQIFTLNYDPLLYWVVNWIEVEPDVCRADGFGRRDGELVWLSDNEQLVHYLHGALHLYEDGDALRKVAYSSRSPIVGKIRQRLLEKKLPLVVTEGRRAQKEARIAKSVYLASAHRRFGRLDGTLFMHGVSMSANDEHVFSKLKSSASGVRRLYISYVGDAVSTTAADRVHALVENRKKAGGDPLEASFYDAASAEVWRRSPS